MCKDGVLANHDEDRKLDLERLKKRTKKLKKLEDMSEK